MSRLNANTFARKTRRNRSRAAAKVIYDVRSACVYFVRTVDILKTRHVLKRARVANALIYYCKRVIDNKLFVSMRTKLNAILIYLQVR